MSRLERDSRAIPRSLTALGMALLAAGALRGGATQPRAVVFAAGDGGEIHGDLYGGGARGVVLAHGAVFDKRSWRALAEVLAADGLRVLAFDFRGYGASTAGDEPGALYQDVLGAVTWLRRQGVETISLLGASMGGGAVGEAATRLPQGELHKVVLLAAAPIAAPEALTGDSLLFIASRGDRGLPQVLAQYQRAPDPKRLELLPGNAHAQHIFDSEQRHRLVGLIRRFLADD